jgi:hypothetical protein
MSFANPATANAACSNRGLSIHTGGNYCSKGSNLPSAPRNQKKEELLPDTSGPTFAIWGLNNAKGGINRYAANFLGRYTEQKISHSDSCIF